MNRRMMTSRVSGRSMCSRRSKAEGSMNSTRVSTHKSTFSKLRLKNWATSIPTTDSRSTK